MDMDILQDPAKRAEWVYGQPMNPCPKCGSYKMRPSTPIRADLNGTESPGQLLGKWAQATNREATIDGVCCFMCADCRHHAPGVDCTGRSSADVGKDAALSAEMKRLWNSQT